MGSLTGIVAVVFLASCTLLANDQARDVERIGRFRTALQTLEGASVHVSLAERNHALNEITRLIDEKWNPDKHKEEYRDALYLALVRNGNHDRALMKRVIDFIRTIPLREHRPFLEGIADAPPPNDAALAIEYGKLFLEFLMSSQETEISNVPDRHASIAELFYRYLLGLEGLSFPKQEIILKKLWENEPLSRNLMRLAFNESANPTLQRDSLLVLSRFTNIDAVILRHFAFLLVEKNPEVRVAAALLLARNGFDHPLILDVIEEMLERHGIRDAADERYSFRVRAAADAVSALSLKDKAEMPVKTFARWWSIRAMSFCEMLLKPNDHDR
ncbi:MAG: hypothetical protein AB1540_14635 [Bdellovibrionota bacterium]